MPIARPWRKPAHVPGSSLRNDLSEPLAQNSSTMHSLSAPSFHTPPQSRTRFGWWSGAMMISSALNFANSPCVIFATRMVLTATACSLRSVALYTVPNLRWWGGGVRVMVREAMRRGGSVDHTTCAPSPSLRHSLTSSPPKSMSL